MSDFWRPISTAPDGLTEVWAWFPHVEKAMAVKTFHYSHGGVGIVYSTHEATGKPSHWHPLPRPPLTHSGDPA